ncbi:MAG: hypothetical protein Q9165_001356 [Trypethelium subeluteriae]
MPLGFERLNERTQRPNPLINFIKPLPGPNSHLAEDFLSRIAAIVLPIMRANYIAVMALEEYPPNPEFAGRNFNAGEVIQLVLRGRSGGWLPFRSVQMVMVHELAHCKQMNHSRYFWGVRNAYAEELRGLWAKAYTGDGLWGKGRTMLVGEYGSESASDPREEPRSLCGGTFRSGGRKRKKKAGVKDKPKESYAERQQKRIRRKFGEGGVTLGDDEGARMVLEKGKMQSGKPRVAGSKRGRELRAAAALARFDQAGKEQQTKHELRDSGSETEWESEADVSPDQQALDIDGKKMLDQQGRGLFKVCEDEDKHDINVKRELDELHELDDWKSLPPAEDQPQNLFKKEPGDLGTESKQKPSLDEPDRTFRDVSDQSRNDQQAIVSQYNLPSFISQEAQKEIQSGGALNKPEGHDNGGDKSYDRTTCAICSLKNDSETLTCMACGNFLDLDRLPNHWRCQSLACRGGLFVNAGDCGICGACGAARRLTEK